MGHIIDKHFYDELFVEKKVSCYKDIYLYLYNEIWPSAKDFEKFLISTETSLKLDTAKRIYEAIALRQNIFLPTSIVSKVIEDQYINLVKDNKLFVPQDHVIHSIYLYVLGIYIFFNSSIISNKLIGNESDLNDYNRIKKFIFKWQIFAFYHDMGYYFEDKKEDKDTQCYKEIFKEIVSYWIIKNAARTLTYKSIAEKSKCKFSNNIFNEMNTIWYDERNNQIEISELKKQLKKYNGFQCFEGILNDKDLFSILSLFEDEEYMLVICNNIGNPISVIIRKNEETLKMFCANSTIKEDLSLNNIHKMTNPKYKLRYYFQDIISEEIWKKAVNDLLVIDDVYSNLPLHLKNIVDINGDNIELIYEELYNWLQNSKVSNSDEEKKQYNNNYNKCYQQSVEDALLDAIREKVEKDYFVVSINELKKKMKSISGNLITDNLLQIIRDGATSIYDETYGAVHNINGFCIKIFKQILGNEFFKQAETDLNIFEMKENKYSISPFNYNKNNSFQESFYKEIEKLSVNLGINLSDLLSYKPEHAFYDHGVISASIMFQVISFNNELKNYCAEKGVLSLAQNRLPDLYKDELQMYAQCVFSILLHNIYNKKSKPAYGIDYYQNMDKDSFSYFCAFCDTIQRWGRPKQIDPAKTDLPEENYLEDEFDIHIADNRIYISCIEKYLKSIKNMINYAENFLPGISSLIKINLY